MSRLEGLGPLVRFVVARDRWRFLAWIVGIVVLVISTAASTKGIYPTPESLEGAAALVEDNPAALAFNGPAQSLETIGGQVAFQLGAFGLIIVGLMTLLLVGRLTRTEEDSGRLELVRSMPVGRHAPLGAALAVVIALDVVAGTTVTACLLSQGLPLVGSVALGASYAAFGFAFVGITAVSAQIAENPRVASGAAGGVLGLSFAVRAVGDVSGGGLSWLSPMGWAQKVRPYAGEQVAPLVLLLALGAGLVWVAVALSERRDFGAGVVAPRPGPAQAAPALASPLGLAARLSRGTVVWWGLSVAALGLVYGSLAQNIDDFVVDNEALAEMLAGFGGADLTSSYLATSLLITALLAAGPGLQIAGRLRTEESAMRTEAVLATPTGRVSWSVSHLVTALAAGAIAMTLGGLAMGAGYSVTGGGARQVPRLLAASLAYVPAIWVLTGLGAAAYGLRPRLVAAGWVALAGCFVIAMFGPLLDLPAWALDLSPFQHTPAAPAEGIRPFPLVVLVVLAGALAALGIGAFRRRDLVTA
jgi:ABC-2 type transport system permease protein